MSESDERSVEEKNELRLSRDIKTLLEESRGGYKVVEILNHGNLGLMMHLMGPTCEPYIVHIVALPKTAHEPLDEQV